MPTGYTAAINDGISFKDFAMNCARAFGACVTLRDEAGGGEVIPDRFEPSSYNLEALNKARSQLSAVLEMTPEEDERAAGKGYDDAETHRVMRIAEMAEQRRKYEAMLAAVRSWSPPTPEHVEYHAFMKSQIEQSIDFDCKTSYYETPTPRLTGPQWREQRLADLNRDISYHSKGHADEVRRAEQRTAWVQALRRSLEAA